MNLLTCVALVIEKRKKNATQYLQSIPRDAPCECVGICGLWSGEANRKCVLFFWSSPQSAWHPHTALCALFIFKFVIEAHCWSAHGGSVQREGKKNEQRLHLHLPVDHRAESGPSHAQKEPQTIRNECLRSKTLLCVNSSPQSFLTHILL